MRAHPDFSEDLPVLSALGCADAPLIGYGGEARVYAVDDDRVLRLRHPGAGLDAARQHTAFLQEISAAARQLDFRTPQVLELFERAGRVGTFEVKLPGRPVKQWLETTPVQQREQLIHTLLEAAMRVRQIDIRRDRFGEIAHEVPVRTASWTEYLARRAAKNLAAAPAEFNALDARGIAAALPAPEVPALVHLDLFSGNVLIDDGKLSAIIDFGPTTIMGDARLDAWSAAAYLDAELSPAATDPDRQIAHAWLASRGLLDGYEAARRWVAAYWTFAHDDPKVMAWCRAVLL